MGREHDITILVDRLPIFLLITLNSFDVMN